MITSEREYEVVKRQLTSLRQQVIAFCPCGVDWIDKAQQSVLIGLIEETEQELKEYEASRQGA